MPQDATSDPVAMFMSMDLSGSTAYKAQMQSAYASPQWLEAFEAFFREAPLIMEGQIARVFAAEDDVPVSGVWKVIGDEIVFMARPRTAREAHLVTVAFYRAVIDFDRRIFERWPLRIKGCCWAAQIGARNREIEIPEMLGRDENHPYLDYLGPDIDTGFRLTGCVGRGQVVVSANLVELLAGLPEAGDVEFHFVGRRVLKGVYKGRPYPLFLMSMRDLKPQAWEWEAEEDAGLVALSKDQPMPKEEILELLGNIQTYLNRMGHTGVEGLQFSAPEDGG